MLNQRSNHCVCLSVHGKVFMFGISNFSNRDNLRASSNNNALKPIKIYTEPHNVKNIHSIKKHFC